MEAAHWLRCYRRWKTWWFPWRCEFTRGIQQSCVAIEVYPHGDPWCFVSLKNPMNCPLMVEPPKNLSAPLTGNRTARKSQNFSQKGKKSKSFRCFDFFDFSSDTFCKKSKVFGIWTLRFCFFYFSGETSRTMLKSFRLFDFSFFLTFRYFSNINLLACELFDLSTFWLFVFFLFFDFSTFRSFGLFVFFLNLFFGVFRLFASKIESFWLVGFVFFPVVSILNRQQVLNELFDSQKVKVFDLLTFGVFQLFIFSHWCNRYEK